MRRLVICCDGTWKTDDDRCPTNVVKIRDSVLSVAPDGTDQIIYYSKGVGATGNKVRRIIAGAFGGGLAADVRNAYAFIVQNYRDGDEIFLFGFSRGAYTARSVAGMIRTCGILPKAKAERTAEAWQIYRIPNAQKKADKPEAVKFRTDNQCRMPQIKFIGVWDTVGALGVPVGRFIRRWSQARHSFHDTGLSSAVENAYHALALDEGRYTFEAALWQQKPAQGQTIEQVWFSGAHSNVGGGYADTGLSDIALLWMAEKARACQLALDLSNVENVRANCEGELVDSRWLKFLPGNLREVGAHPQWGESVHPTVTQRLNSAAAVPSPYKPHNYPGPLKRPLLVRLLRRLFHSGA
ncbi:MAG TPA: DUF2235 domain-containing protein [Thermoanaerobaculia bacterium]|jgi:uncharacterized protein (DUF2235 family)